MQSQLLRMLRDHLTQITCAWETLFGNRVGLPLGIEASVMTPDNVNLFGNRYVPTIQASNSKSVNHLKSDLDVIQTRF